jgi:hypothetical protein
MRISAALPLLASAGLMSAACAAPRPAGFLSACAAAAQERADMRTIRSTGFSFQIPADYERVDIQPIDSRVERWEAGPGRAITYDLGPWSSTLDELRVLRGHSECRRDLGGKPAKVVAGLDEEGKMFSEGRKYVVAATWRDIQPGLHLTVAATTPDAREQAALLRVLHSVTFER